MTVATGWKVRGRWRTNCMAGIPDLKYWKDRTSGKEDVERRLSVARKQPCDIGVIGEEVSTKQDGK